MTQQEALQEQIRLQEEFNRLQEESKRLAKEVRDAGDAATQSQKDALNVAKEAEKQEKKRLDSAKARVKEFDTIQKKSDAAFRSFARLGSEVTANLGSLTDSSNVFLNVQREIIKLEEKREGLSEAEVESVEARAAFLRQINQSQLSQAQSTAKAMEDAKGLNEFEKQRQEIQQNSLGLSEEQKRMALETVNQTENAFKQEQRILAIKEQQKGLIDQMPDGIKDSIGFAKGLGDAIKTGVGPLFLLGAVVALVIKSFTDLEAAASEFRKETGLTNSQTQEIRSNVNEIVGEYGKLGVEAKDVYDTVAALKKEFSDVYNVSKETTAALTVLSKNFGVATEDAAAVQGIYERMGGLSSETAANVQMQAAEMANMAGVAPAKVAKDIAEAAEESYKFFKGDVVALNRAAIEARRMGSNLKEVLEINRKLLDFEGGIEDELVAATFVSGQFNLTKARTLAASGEEILAQEEILRQIQRSGDFRKQDLFTQEALAKASGMEVGEIIKQLDAQDKLASLSKDERDAAQKAIEQGLDITDISADQLAQETEKFAKQQEQQAVLEKITNQFTGMAATIGSVLLPVFEAILLILEPINWAVWLIDNTFGAIGEKISSLIGPLQKVGKFMKGLVGAAILYAAYSVYGWLTSASMGFGTIAAAAWSAAIVATGFTMLSKIGDLNSPADGKTRVSTKEGGLFELSPNDDLVAAPGAADALSNMSGGNTNELASNTNSEKEGGLFSRVFGKDKEDGEGLPSTINVDFTALSAPLNAMINEIKALRADMASGKIAVYMDTAKVTSNIGKQVDQTTRNNYSLGQA